MAKRELQEINAGSMADIAFLLLIFFLVTTTMDKDTAFVRSIPKKVEVVQDPVPVEERNILAIKANNQNQLMVRGEIFNDPAQISEFILKFYKTNEINNDVANNFPLYSHTSMKQIDDNIRLVEAEAEELENKGAVKSMIEFKYTQLEEWVKKKRALELLGGTDLPEIHFQANIRIEVQQATSYEIFAQIQTEIQEAIYKLRDDKAQELWSESYGTLKRKFDAENGAQEKAKLDLLDILYPARIIEVTPKK